MHAEAGSIEKRSLGEQVYGILCSRILDGKISYGESINSRLLAQELGVSPMPVREAIKRLHNEGLVIIKPRSTCLLKRPTRHSIRGAIEMRELLQVFFVGKIVAGEAAPELSLLERVVAAMRAESEAAEDPGRLRRFIDLDRQFHTEIARLAGNEFAEKSYRELSLHLATKFIYDISAPPDLPLTYRDHLEILEALRLRSSEAPERMRRHLRRSHESVLGGELFKTLD